MNDLISRQSAIDVLSQYPFEKVVNCLSILEELPSVQPTQKNDSNALDALDCVSRKAAIEFRVSHGLNEDGRLYVSFDEVRKYLEQLPSAQPDKNMIHLQKEQAYMQGWEDGREALRKEILDER